jgi:hypothetical protein
MVKDERFIFHPGFVLFGLQTRKSGFAGHCTIPEKGMVIYINADRSF